MHKKLVKDTWDKYDTEAFFDKEFVQIWINRKLFREIMRLKEKYQLSEYPTPFILNAFLYSAIKHKRHTIMKYVFRDLFFGGYKK